MYWKFNLNPAIVKFGRFEIRWYGLMYVISMISAYLLMKYFIRKGSLILRLNQLDNLITYVFVGLLVGARFFYIVFYNFSYYLRNPIEVFAFWQGGLSFHGGLAGITFAVFLFARKNRLSLKNLGDHLVLCGSIGIFFGRLGNFINGELWGRITEVPWAIIFPDGGPLPRHPSQLYESFFEGFLMSIILFFILKNQKRPGTTMFSFLCLYPLFRFFIEFFREPDSQLGFIIYGLSMGQLLCLAMLTAGLIFFKTSRSGVKT